MSKKVILVFSVLLLMVFAVPAFGAIIDMTDDQKKEVTDLHKKIIELRKQMIDKYVEAGQLTADQGKNIKENIDKAEENRENNGILPGAGFGRGNGRGGNCGAGGCGNNGFGCGGAGGNASAAIEIEPQGFLQ